VKRKLGITRIIDLSATQFFLSGSGYAEGTLRSPGGGCALDCSFACFLNFPGNAAMDRRVLSSG
jgi:hypothetical protein